MGREFLRSPARHAPRSAPGHGRVGDGREPHAPPGRGPLSGVRIAHHGVGEAPRARRVNANTCAVPGV